MNAQPRLTPYDRCRIAMETIGAVIGNLQQREEDCPWELFLLRDALEDLEFAADELEPRP